MSSEALALSENSGAFANLATRNGERTLIISSGAEARLSRLVRRIDDDHPSAKLETIAISGSSSADALKEIVLQHGIERICAVLPVGRCSLLETVSSVARELGLELSVQLKLASEFMPSRKSGQGELAFELFRHPANRFPGRLMKRLLDMMGAFVALAVLAPLMLVAAAAVKLTSSGPVFFLQPRVGRRRRIFRMIKFRTMVADAEELRREVAHKNHARGISFKVIDDPRLTKVGSLLRKASIDELPQLFNVLLGDMSLVGPRPIPTWVADQLCDTRYHRRFSVLPGMTGLWQVKGRRQDFDYMAERDLDYVEDWSLWLDMKLLAATPSAVIRGEGAH